MKKRKIKKIRGQKLIFLIVIFLLLALGIFNFNNLVYFYQSKITGYDVGTIATFHELDVYDKIKKYKYSNTLEKVINDNNSFNNEYLLDYLNINYHDSDDFLIDINSLLSLGYDYNDINLIYDSLSLDNIDLVLNNYYYDDLFNILMLDYFDEDNLLRYYDYNKKKELNYKDIVTYVNIGLDNEYYTNVNKISNQDDILVLVNKYNALSSDYVPNDLEKISSKFGINVNNKLRHDARVAFEEMCEAALRDNIKIYSGSAYRSYNYQADLYNQYVAENGKKNADTFSARAGYSEHQTGLAVDILNANFVYVSSTDKEYKWLLDNSYKYGFILRYPLNKEKVTGYKYEEWHFRYLGKELAEKLYKEDITYDEYVIRYLKNS